MDDYEVDYESACSVCGHEPIHYRDCQDCDDGYEEVFYDDVEIPGWGEEIKCQTCNGTGTETWCPSCGKDLSGYKFEEQEL